MGKCCKLGLLLQPALGIHKVLLMDTGQGCGQTPDPTWCRILLLPKRVWAEASIMPSLEERRLTVGTELLRVDKGCWSGAGFETKHVHPHKHSRYSSICPCPGANWILNKHPKI